MKKLHQYRKKGAKKAAKTTKAQRPVKPTKKAVKKAIKKAVKKAAPKKAVKVKKNAPHGRSIVIKRGNFVARITNKSMKGEDLIVEDAKYLHDYILLVTFSDGKEREVDFSPFITANNIAYLSKYKAINNFLKFKVEDGNVVWGKDWDLIFPVKQLYSGKVTV